MILKLSGILSVEKSVYLYCDDMHKLWRLKKAGYAHPIRGKSCKIICRDVPDDLHNKKVTAWVFVKKYEFMADDRLIKGWSLFLRKIEERCI